MSDNEKAASMEPGRFTIGIVAYYWERRAKALTKQAMAQVNSDEKQKADCGSTSCGLPMSADRKVLHERSVAALLKAIRWGRAGANNYYNLYWHYHHLGDLEAGERACRRSLRANPNYAPAANGLGRCLQLTGKYEAAAAAFEVNLTLEPDVASVYEDLSNAYLLHDRYDEMARVCVDGRKRFPEHRPLLRLHYLALTHLEMPEEALACAEEAAALDPEDFGTQVALGHVLRTLDRKAEGMRAFRRATELVPGSHRAIEPLVDMLAEEGNTEGILSLLCEQANHTVADPTDGARLGKLLLEYQCYELAKVVLLPSAAATDHTPIPQLHLSQALRALGEEKAASEALQEAVRVAEYGIQKLEETLPILRELGSTPIKGMSLNSADVHEMYTHQKAVEVFLEAGMPDRVATCLDRVRELAPEEAAPFEEKIVAHREQSDP